MVVQAASKCLFAINEQYNIPSTLPPSMSAKFRIGSSIATACQVGKFIIYIVELFLKLFLAKIIMFRILNSDDMYVIRNLVSKVKLATKHFCMQTSMNLERQ